MKTNRSLRKSPTARTRSPERTRAQLLGAARALFAKHGLHGASVADIAAQAGVSTAMINHHFGGKLELYRACLAGFGERRLRVVDRHLVAPKSREELRVRLEVLVTDLFAVHLEHRDVVNILFRDLAIADQWGPGIEKALYEFTKRFAQFFELAQKAGFMRADVNPIAPATMIYLTLSGLVQADAHRTRVTRLGITDEKHRAAVVQVVMDVVLNGI